MHNERLMTIHSGPWKYFVNLQKAYVPPTDLSNWKDRRGPDGVTIIAPYEQATPADYPGLTTGADCKPGTLFNILDDPGEQTDVSREHPEVVQRMIGYSEKAKAEIPVLERPDPTHPFRRVKGGRLDFWNTRE
jgi:uncharacterized sulfatase